MKTQTVEEFAAELETLAVTFEKAIPEALTRCKPIILEDIAQHFARQESPDGIAWPARAKIGDGHPLLVETKTIGTGSLLSAATGQGGGHVSRIEGDTLIVGVDKMGGIGGIPGAAVHNEGYAVFNIPQREFLGIGADASVECGTTIAECMMEKAEL